MNGARLSPVVLRRARGRLGESGCRDGRWRWWRPRRHLVGASAACWADRLALNGVPNPRRSHPLSYCLLRVAARNHCRPASVGVGGGAADASQAASRAQTSFAAAAAVAATVTARNAAGAEALVAATDDGWGRAHLPPHQHARERSFLCAIWAWAQERRRCVGR